MATQVLDGVASSSKDAVGTSVADAAKRELKPEHRRL